MNFALKPAYDRKEEVRELFMEYTDMLVAGEPRFVEYLGIQNFDQELRHLEKKYGMPSGRLYLLDKTTYKPLAKDIPIKIQ